MQSATDAKAAATVVVFKDTLLTYLNMIDSRVTAVRATDSDIMIPIPDSLSDDQLASVMFELKRLGYRITPHFGIKYMKLEW